MASSCGCCTLHAKHQPERVCTVAAAGTTLTLAVVSGWLLTVANTGDSNAIIDSGDDVQEITHSHRIQVGGASGLLLKCVCGEQQPDVCNCSRQRQLG